MDREQREQRQAGGEDISGLFDGEQSLEQAVQQVDAYLDVGYQEPGDEDQAEERGSKAREAVVGRLHEDCRAIHNSRSRVLLLLCVLPPVYGHLLGRRDRDGHARAHPRLSPNSPSATSRIHLRISRGGSSR